MNQPSSLALITGGSRGLGRSAAEHLAATGADVLITYHSNRDAADEVVARIRGLGRRASALQLDVSKASSFPSFVDAVKATLAAEFARDAITALVNNAGAGVHASFADTTEAQFDAMMNMHLKGTFFLTQRVAPLIARGGRILNVSSGLTRFSLPGYAAYAAMKGGVEVLTRYLAKELGARGISVNTLAPGAIETDFGGGAVRDNAELNGFIASQTALGRVGRPEDIGALIAQLVSAESGWINGQRIEASGGMFL